jgi:hypothetical protein
VGYVLPSEVLADLRVFLQRDTGAREALVKRHALDLLGQLARTDGLDSERLHELATWAREQARARDKTLGLTRPGETERVDAAFGSDFTGSLRRKQAELARIIEISTDVLTALALDKLPPEAVLNIGRDDEQVNAKSPRFRWPDADERAFMGRMAAMVEQATSGEPDPGEAMFMRIGANLGLAAELAANGKMSRAEVEALPSHDRVVLVRIFESLLGVPDSSPRKADASASAEDVWDELEATRVVLADHLAAEGASWPDIIRITARLDGDMLKLARERDEARHALTAPRYSLPGSHPLRQYQWAEWLRSMVGFCEQASIAGFYRAPGGRIEWLNAAIARVEALDVDGLRGMVERAHEGDRVIELAWNDLLLFACQSRRSGTIEIEMPGGALRVGCHRVPRVRGETAEVGK